jgi:exodeoxyribonuclease V alpha subunit
VAEVPNPLGVLAGRPFAPEAWLRAAGDPGLVALAWELARIPKDLDGPTRRRLHLLLSLLLAAQAQGSSRLALVGPSLEALHRAFGEAPVDWVAFLEDPRLAILIGDPGAGRPLVRIGDTLASRRLLAAETRIGEHLRTRLAQPRSELMLPEEVLAAPVALNPEQRAAVAAAVCQPLTLVTGGPGTGKTSILSAILRTLVATGLDPEAIALAAPTGKAAQRMGEAVSGVSEALPEPRTLHRLLGWDPRLGRFRHGAAHPLRLKALLVDEASMIGLELMDALLDALPVGAHMVLLGDADQLPSVEAGTVFRDLVTGLPGAVARLTRSHRLDMADPGGRAILEAAQALRAGQDPNLMQAAGLDGIEAPGIRLWPAGDTDLRVFLRRWRARRPAEVTVLNLREGRLDAASQDRLAALAVGWNAARLLCLLREGDGPHCADGVNAFLHGEALKAAGPHRAPAPFLPGEPVLARRNDYARGLFNGDQGLVVLVSRDGAAPQPEAVFPRPEGPAWFPLVAVQAGLEHAYALTVHKAQGSEYDHVALVLPEQDHLLLTREILYTALTRAKRSVDVLGDPTLLALGAARPLQREGGLSL